MHVLWEDLRAALPLIVHGDPYLMQTIGFTLQVAAIATALASLIGVPIGVALGLGRFRGRQALVLLANAGLALPPVLVGLLLFILFLPGSPIGGLHLVGSRSAVFIAQTILALPFVIALTTAAINGLPRGILAQARAFGAGRRHLSVLAVREARIGVIAAILAALGTTLSEVGAVIIVGGNIYGYDQTLASATLWNTEVAMYPEALALGIVLSVMILILMCSVGLLQHRREGLGLRFRQAS
jgi:tungstate transport system permease protein